MVAEGRYGRLAPADARLLPREDGVPLLNRLALKLDVDTFEGTRDGVPRLLELFKSRGVRVSIYFSLGPDNSGRAIRRIWERPGFFAKMRRTKAASTYGLRTILSGTLLPARAIAPVAAPILRRADADGHEIAVHAWDHVEWHDRLPRWNLDRVRKETSLAFSAFEAAVGRPALASAAPGWMVSKASFEIEDERKLLYASDGRGDEPFLPIFDGRSFATLQIPTTLPTWDEQQGRIGSDDELIGFYRRRVRERELSVHTIHAEVEGGILATAFEKQLDGWLADGVRFVTLEDIARECEPLRESLPRRTIVMKEIEGRAGEVAVTSSAG